MAAVIVTLGCLEGVCRLFDHDQPRPVAGYITMWDDGEFYTVKSAATGWPPWEDYNHDGMRDREHAVDKPAGVRRVMVLGDSVTLGYGLRPEEAFPQVLQDVLDARGVPAEVFNVAFSGWSTRQERIAYERIGRKYRPDDVLVAVCLNDIPEIHNNLSRPPRALAALYARSALVRRLVGAQRREIHDVEELLTAPDSPSVRAAFAAFFDELLRIRAEVARDGGRFAVAVLPFRMQLVSRPAAGGGAPSAQARIAAFCAAEKIPFVDLLPSLRPLGAEGFLDYDHLSAAGARRVAEVLADATLVESADGAPAAPAAQASTGLTRVTERPTAEWLARVADRDPSVRAAAARALGNAGGDPTAAVPALAARLDDRDAGVRTAAVWALGGFGPAAAPARAKIATLLGDGDPAVRAGAAHALGSIGPAAGDTAAALVPHLADASEQVRWRAEDALDRMEPDPPTTLGALRALLADPGGSGRAGAAAVIGRMGASARAAVPELIAALADARAEVRWKAAWALGEIGPEARAAVPSLVALVRDPDVGWHAIDALGSIGPEARGAVPALRTALADPGGNVRWRAAGALGHIGPAAAEAAPDLAPLVRDPVDNVRLAAVHALGRVAPEARATAALLAAAASDKDSRVRAVAVHLLARLPRSAVVTSALARALQDPDAGVRGEAIAAGRRH